MRRTNRLSTKRLKAIREAQEDFSAHIASVQPHNTRRLGNDSCTQQHEGPHNWHNWLARRRAREETRGARSQRRRSCAPHQAEQKAWLDGVSFPRAAGCVGYDIVRATDAADHFVVIESWPSKGARLAHTLETDGYEEYVYSDATVDAVFRGPSRLA